MTNLADNWLPRHRLTVEDYHRMGETGILRPEARVELIEGEIIDMAPIGSRHASAVARLTHLFARTGDTALVWVQNPILLDDHSEPEPDLVLLRPRGDFYREALPHAEDVLLLVEVAETTLRYDRDVKLPLYARYRVPEVWIVDLDSRALLVCRDPAGAAYADIRTLDQPRQVAPRLLPECVFDLTGLL